MPPEQVVRIRCCGFSVVSPLRAPPGPTKTAGVHESDQFRTAASDHHVMLVVALIGGGGLAIFRMRVDIFPPFNLPQIYVIQNFNGMSPAQMEGLIVNQFELNFQYVDGVKNVESRSIQQIALIKLSFYPGTDMSQAMAEVVAQANRAQAFMPPGVLPPQIMRMDAGSVPIGYLVLRQQERDRWARWPTWPSSAFGPLLQAKVPGTVGTAPFGSNVRSIVINVDPERLRSYNLTPEDVVKALADRQRHRSGGQSVHQGPDAAGADQRDGRNIQEIRQDSGAAGPQRLHRRRGDGRRRHRRQFRLRHGRRPALGVHPGRQEEHRPRR